MTCLAVFGVFLTVLGALPPRVRIGDCMKCECESNCGGIPSRDARNDRLYWIELNSGSLKGTRCAAWRTGRDPGFPWVADLPPLHESSDLSHEGVADQGVRIIHEIIPED